MKILDFLAGLVSPAMIAAAALVLAVALTAGPANAATELLLRETIRVTDDVVTLGDIFVNAGDKADAPVSRAPEPGTRAAISATHVAAAARGNGFLWPNHERTPHLIVLRTGNQVPNSVLDEALSDAIANYTTRPGASYRITYQQTPAPLFVAIGAPQDLEITDLAYDARSGSFQARAGTGSDSTRRIRLTGKAMEVRRIPVPDVAITRGQPISEADLGWIEMEADRIAPGIVTDPSEMVGLVPRSNLRRGQTVRVAELREPVAVTKDSLVTITFEVPGMLLTARGRALQDGALDEVIPVINTRSHRTVQARVLGPERVAVESDSAVALAETPVASHATN